MERKPLKLTNDITFQRMFGKIGNENITKGFLEKVLGIEIDELTLDTNKRLIGKERDGKIGRVDVKAKLSDGTKAIIEMQVERYEYMAKRMLYYWAENYVGDLRRGQQYEDLQKTICILIYVGQMDETRGIKEYHTKWKLYEENHPDRIFSDDIEMHILELSKFREGEKPRPEDNWIRLIKSKGVDDMGLYEDAEKEIQEALKELERMEGDPNLREEYEALEYDIREKSSRIRAARETGIKQGRLQGKEEEQKRIILNMYKKGIKIEEISDIVDLKKEEIQEIIKDNINLKF